MKNIFRKIISLKGLALLWLVALIVPTVTAAQTYSPDGFSQVINPNIASQSQPFTLSTACTLPTPPTITSCPAGSFARISANGGGELSLQIPTLNGATIAFFNSNDGVNLLTSSFGQSGTTPLQTVSTTATTGKYTAGLGGSTYIYVIATVAPTSAITITPNVSAHTDIMSLHSSISLAVHPDPSNSPFNVIVTNPTAPPTTVPVSVATTLNVHSVDATPTPGPSPYATNAFSQLVIAQATTVPVSIATTLSVNATIVNPSSPFQLVAPYPSASPFLIAPFPGASPISVNTAPPYVAPTCAAAPQAPCVQITGVPAVTVTGAPNVTITGVPQVAVSGPVTVNTAAPYVAPTCAAAPQAPCVQITGSISTATSPPCTFSTCSNTAAQAALTGNGFTHYATTQVTSASANVICAQACTAAGVMVGWFAPSNTTCVLNIYNSTAATVGTTTIVGLYPFNTATPGSFAAPIPPTIGGKFTTGLSYSLTTTVGGTTACNTASNALWVEAWYV